MDKMCTVQELLDSGYSCNNLTISRGGGKCIIVKDFTTYFYKKGYGLSVRNRKENRLFPLSDINEIPDMIWSEDGEWPFLCYDSKISDKASMSIMVEYFSGDIDSITAEMSLLNDEDIEDKELSSYGLGFQVSNLREIDASKGEYDFMMTFTVTDENLFKSTFEGGNSWTITVSAVGKNGKNSYFEPGLRIEDCGGGGGSSIGTIKILTEYEVIGVDDSKVLNIQYENIDPLSFKIISILTSFDNVDCTLRLANDTSTTGTAYLTVYRSTIDNQGIYDLYLNAYDTDGNDIDSNTVQIDLD